MEVLDRDGGGRIQEGYDDDGGDIGQRIAKRRGRRRKTMVVG